LPPLHRAADRCGRFRCDARKSAGRLAGYSGAGCLLGRRANNCGWCILTPFVAFSSLAAYVASTRLLRRGMLLSELPAGKSRSPSLGRMGSDSAVGGRTSQICKCCSARDWALPGRAVHGTLHAKGADNESSAVISNSDSARSDNRRRKHSHASTSQASRARAECGAAASRPSGRRIYEDVEGHDREIGTAKA
jgi:hypothetical protein